jgi:FixJ family two-component response regulator
METPAPIIHVVDDDDSVRTALARVLRAAGFETRAYRSAVDFLLAERPKAPGCIVLDVRMPGLSGTDLHRKLATEEGSLPVVFLTGKGDIPMSVFAIKAGAVDFLTKPARAETLLHAVRAAVARDVDNRKMLEEKRELHSRYQNLTVREREVFTHVTEGRLNKQIAADLGTSERTIKAHRAQVMQKMRAGSVAELVRAADQLK